MASGNEKESEQLALAILHGVQIIGPGTILCFLALMLGTHFLISAGTARLFFEPGEIWGRTLKFYGTWIVLLVVMLTTFMVLAFFALLNCTQAWNLFRFFGLLCVLYYCMWIGHVRDLYESTIARVLGFLIVGFLLKLISMGVVGAISVPIAVGHEKRLALKALEEDLKMHAITETKEYSGKKVDSTSTLP